MTLSNVCLTSILPTRHFLLEDRKTWESLFGLWKTRVKDSVHFSMGIHFLLSCHLPLFFLFKKWMSLLIEKRLKQVKRVKVCHVIQAEERRDVICKVMPKWFKWHEKLLDGCLVCFFDWLSTLVCWQSIGETGDLLMICLFFFSCTTIRVKLTESWQWWWFGSQVSLKRKWKPRRDAVKSNREYKWVTVTWLTFVRTNTACKQHTWPRLLGNHSFVSHLLIRPNLDSTRRLVFHQTKGLTFHLSKVHAIFPDKKKIQWLLLHTSNWNWKIRLLYPGNVRGYTQSNHWFVCLHNV